MQAKDDGHATIGAVFLENVRMWTPFRGLENNLADFCHTPMPNRRCGAQQRKAAKNAINYSRNCGIISLLVTNNV